MTHQFDDFSKSLAESLPRRESLRRMGSVIAGAVLSQLGLGTAWAGKQDPCKAFCNRCSNKKQNDQCLAACQACNGNTGRLGGSCGKYVCCPTASCGGVCSDLKSDPNCGACGNNCGAHGETCCGNYCADLKNDFDNCGRCGAACDDPAPFENGACVQGACVYGCAEGAMDCDGICTPMNSDPLNCGACGNVCSDPTPYCSEGVCNDCGPGTALCGGQCIDIWFDGNNCGACGWQCSPLEHCSFGYCEGSPGG